MKALPKSQILRFTEKAIHLARRAVSRYSSKFYKHRYTLPQHVVLLCLKVRKNTTYRGLLEELTEMPRIRRVLGLAELTIQQLKVTLLVDSKVNAIHDLHVTTTRKHDSQIAPSLIKRNPESIDILLGDKGYDDQKIRRLTHHHEIRPLVKHREFISLHKAWNARLDTGLYGQRSQSETVNSTLKRKYGAFVRSRRWWKQFRELTIACLIHNVDRSL